MKDRKGGKRHGGSGDAPTISDPRFRALHSDPRFQKLPRNKFKVAVDKRFERMFTDKEFLDPFSVDKRGRPKEKKQKRTLERYYKLGDEDEEVKGEETQEKISVFEKPKQEVSLQDEEEEEGAESSSSESDASSTSSESEASEVEEEQDSEEEEKVATTETETRRIAVVNMDWAHVKAADLLVLFSSFLPKGGRVESVTVYPSQFGLEQMKQEEVKGPQIFKDDDPDDEDGAAINQQKLREYEKSKLRYYFAVVVCDSVSTASFLYNACDGTEFERTSNILDLRFISDDMQFEAEPRDTATEAPPNYDAPDFCTGALQHSKVKLTWDDDEAVRVKQLRRKFNAEELENMDFKTYLASDDDEEEDDDDEKEGKKEDKVMKYKSLLLGDEISKKSSKHDIDMEVTFPSGLEELSKKFSEQKQKQTNGEETVWEAFLRKKKEKKKGKQQPEEDAEAAGQKQVDKKPAAEDDEFNDPFFNSDHDGEAENASDADDDGEQLQQPQSPRLLSSVEERQKKREERLQRKRDEANSKAELELLLMDDRAAADADGVVKGFNLKKKKERGKKRKGKDDTDAQAEDLFTKTNYDDPRFQSLFTSPDFAVDPTNPQFKRSAAKLRAVAELQQMRFKRRTEDQDKATDGNNKQKAELSSLVRSVKRKVAK